MTALLSTFGAMAFGTMAMIIFIMGREYSKLKTENKQLHNDLDSIMQIMPNISSEELEAINDKFIQTEEIIPCQKS